jgi:hypothetical protein
MSLILRKQDPTCNLTQLLDSYSCLATSLSSINYNFVTLTNEITGLQNQISSFIGFNPNNPTNDNGDYMYNDQTGNQIMTLSAAMIDRMYNIQKIQSVYSDPYSLIQNLSSQWSYKEFSIYYPSIFDLTSYNNQKAIYEATISSWLYQFFPANSFPAGQIMNLFITYSYTNYFNFEFKGNYLENCAPQGHSANTISCNGCGSDTRWGGCNHDAHGRHWCDNAYSYCTNVATTQSEAYTCQGYVGDTIDFDNVGNVGSYDAGNTGYLYIDYAVQNIPDQFVARIVGRRMQNQYDQNGFLNWTII